MKRGDNIMLFLLLEFISYVLFANTWDFIIFNITVFMDLFSTCQIEQHFKKWFFVLIFAHLLHILRWKIYNNICPVFGIFKHNNYLVIRKSANSVKCIIALLRWLFSACVSKQASYTRTSSFNFECGSNGECHLHKFLAGLLCDDWLHLVCVALCFCVFFFQSHIFELGWAERKHLQLKTFSPYLDISQSKLIFIY